MSPSDRARRRFVIHVFAGVAAMSGCKHDGDTATQALAPSDPGQAHAAQPRDGGSRAAIADTTRVSDASADANPFAAFAYVDPGLGGRMGGAEGTIGLGNLGFAAGGARLGGTESDAPLVRLAVPTIHGLLSMESIRRVVRHNLEQVVRCQQRALARNPSQEGRVIVRFVISGTGTVLGATVPDSTTMNPNLNACIAAAVRRWVFASPEDGEVVTVLYPFVLQHREIAPTDDARPRAHSRR